MQWLSISDFFYMGGYAFYVWGSFGITALVAVFEIWQVRALRREILRNLSSETESDTDSLANTP